MKTAFGYFTKVMAFITILVRAPGMVVRNVSRAWKKIFVKSEPVIIAVLCAMLLTITAARYASGHAMADYNPVEPIENETEVEEIIFEDFSEKAQIEAIAKVLYGTAQYNTEAGKKLVCWCIFNRVEHPNYPNDVIGVCAQNLQWMGYSDENPILQDLYNIAEEEYTSWKSGAYRPVGPDYIFMSWSSNEIVLRTEFSEGKSTHYWYE